MNSRSFVLLILMVIYRFNQNMEAVESAEEYMTVCITGGRQYILKESLDTLPRARMQLRMLDGIFLKTIVLQMFILECTLSTACAKDFSSQ